MKKLINLYSKFVSNHAVLVLILCVIVSIVMIVGMQMMKSTDMNYQDMLPQNYDVIKAFTLIQDEFGGTNSGTIVIQIDDSYPNSNEHLTVLEPEVMRYSLVMENYLKYVDGIEEVDGFGQVLEELHGVIPNSKNEIEKDYQIYGKNYISKDESMALIKISLDKDVDAKKLTIELLNLIEKMDKPQGIKLELSGEVFEDYIVNQELGPDMSKTSMFSMIAILIILFLLFRSLKGVALPIMTIIFGVIWTMGFLGLIGSGISTMTSGAISMIMGIGIDFGIQVMNRFNQELKNNNKKKAMENTLNGILTPIFTTAFACLIGFRTMGLGELSMMAELGKVMSYGVLFCMFAAITIVPSLLLIFTRNKN